MHLVPGMLGHVDQVGNLAVLTVLAGVDHKLDVGPRVLCLELPDHRGRRIGGVADAEDDLDRARIVLPQHRREIAMEFRLGAMQGLEHRHARPCRTRHGIARACAPGASDHDGGEQRVAARRCREDQENDAQNALMSLSICFCTACIMPSYPAVCRLEPYCERQVASWLMVPFR